MKFIHLMMYNKNDSVLSFLAFFIKTLNNNLQKLTNIKS